MAGNSQTSSPWGQIGASMANSGFPAITPQNAASPAVVNEVKNNPMAGWMLPMQGILGMLAGNQGGQPGPAGPQTPQGGQSSGGSPAAPSPQRPTPSGIWGGLFGA